MARGNNAQLALGFTAHEPLQGISRAAMIEWLRSFDHIIISSSAGKDSQAMLDWMVEIAIEAGIKDRLVVVHADLGRLEWVGTRELAAEQATYYGLPFVVVRKSEFNGDFLEYVKARTSKLRRDGKVDRKGRPARAWPMVGMCNGTSDFKTSQIATVATALANETRKAEGSKRQVRILDCVGLAKHEGGENGGRDKRLSSYQDKNGWAYKVCKDNGSQYFAKFYPLADWSLDDVWARIRAAGTRYHFAYDLGMSRLSCCFCIAASEKDLRIAAAHNPELLAEYLDVEKTAGSFKATKTLAQVVEGVEPVTATRTNQAHRRLDNGRVMLSVVK
jgi:3'-phosphoadenosine 5'-phosphosulfate sulfotransferase (PAPS reductase)/FAD synthetase